jgi:hypothetical protein
MARATSRYRHGIVNGYRSGLEDAVAAQLEAAGQPVEYEGYTIIYTKPARSSRYTVDFVLNNGIVIETKGRFLAEDRQKHLLIKQQYPDLDVRFIFQNPHARLTKGSKTTYAMWAEKHGFKWAKQRIPDEWLIELPEERRLTAIMRWRRECVRST